jgi:hypothetical protein
MFSDNPPNTLDGSLNTLFVAKLMKLAGGSVGSGSVALVHVIRQTQAGMNRCRISSSTWTSPGHHQRGSAGSCPPRKVLEGALRMGTYILLRLTALPVHESPQVEAKSLPMSQWCSPQNSSS